MITKHRTVMMLSHTNTGDPKHPVDESQHFAHYVQDTDPGDGRPESIDITHDVYTELGRPEYIIVSVESGRL